MFGATAHVRGQLRIYTAPAVLLNHVEWAILLLTLYDSI